MEVALIGLRSSGKTTLFNLLTGGAPTRPDSQGRVVKGVAKVPDPRLDALARIFNPTKITPAEITFWDLPPPPPSDQDFGYFQGQSLNALQGADAFIHVVRAFQNPTVPAAAGPPTPHRDATAISDELILADLAILERRTRRVAENMKGARGRERDLTHQGKRPPQPRQRRDGRGQSPRFPIPHFRGVRHPRQLQPPRPQTHHARLQHRRRRRRPKTHPDADPITICAGLEWELCPAYLPKTSANSANLWASKTPAKTYFWPKP